MTGRLNRTIEERQKLIVVPDGKLGSFYWYERDRELYMNEKEAMAKFFPQFREVKLPDGRLTWEGTLEPLGTEWYLQLVYENNHPSNDRFGGSIKVYSISPDLTEITQEHGSIPHTLHDSQGIIYLCTSRKEDFIASSNESHTAASSLAWASKWINVFHLWLNGEVSDNEFSGHIF